jgi:putative membrane protein insertion efficiency factor
MKHLCIWLVRLYRKYLSPLKGGPCCRFVPTCSAYAIEAFQKRGFFVGLILTVWRILRCNPMHPGGYDPVPEKGLRYKGTREIPIDEHSDCACGHGEDHPEENDPCRRDDGNGTEQDAPRTEIASRTEDTDE